MHTNRAFLSKFFRRRNIQFYIIFTWCFGLFWGLHIIPMQFSDHVRQLEMDIPVSRNIPLLFILLFVPLAITLIAIHRKKVFLLPALCLIKATLFGFSLYLICMRFSSGSWLAVFLFLFADIVSVCLLLSLWLQQGDSNMKHFIIDAVTACCILIAACCVDGFILTPFLQKIF